MHYHLILTELCDSKCRYCYEKSMREFDNGLEKKWDFDFSVPAKSEVNIDKLRNFLLKDEDAVLIFYGGEPLLEVEKIKEIMDMVDVPFRMQTNAKLLDKLPFSYLKKIDKILVSLDGDKERTDFNRGDGTYETVLKNIEKARKEGYIGEIIARMTLSFPDVYEQVMHLIKNFNSVHWQIDAGFYKNDFNEKEFSDFVEKYNKSISKLVEFWVSEIEAGKVWKFYPFLGVFSRLAGWDNEKRIQCGAGFEGYAITTNGKLVACPIMNNIENFCAGNLESNPENLKKFDVEECSECEVKEICGGRCLYWRKARLWDKKGDDLICKTVKHLIKELDKNKERIFNAIEEGNVKKEDFNFEKYFGPEIIP